MAVRYASCICCGEPVNIGSTPRSISLMLPPEQNPSPAPVRTMQLRLTSALAPARNAVSALTRAGESEFRVAASFSVSRAVDPCRSIRSVGSVISPGCLQQRRQVRGAHRTGVLREEPILRDVVRDMRQGVVGDPQLAES